MYINAFIYVYSQCVCICIGVYICEKEYVILCMLIGIHVDTYMYVCMNMDIIWMNVILHHIA